MTEASVFSMFQADYSSLKVLFICSKTLPVTGTLERSKKTAAWLIPCKWGLPTTTQSGSTLSKKATASCTMQTRICTLGSFAATCGTVTVFYDRQMDKDSLVNGKMTFATVQA